MKELPWHFKITYYLRLSCFTFVVYVPFNNFNLINIILSETILSEFECILEAYINIKNVLGVSFNK